MIAVIIAHFQIAASISQFYITVYITRNNSTRFTVDNKYVVAADSVTMQSKVTVATALKVPISPLTFSSKQRGKESTRDSGRKIAVFSYSTSRNKSIRRRRALKSTKTVEITVLPGE